jgi:hypothetical protein
MMKIVFKTPQIQKQLPVLRFPLPPHRPHPPPALPSLRDHLLPIMYPEITKLRFCCSISRGSINLLLPGKPNFKTSRTSFSRNLQPPPPLSVLYFFFTNANVVVISREKSFYVNFCLGKFGASEYFSLNGKRLELLTLDTVKMDTEMKVSFGTKLIFSQNSPTLPSMLDVEFTLKNSSGNSDLSVKIATHPLRAKVTKNSILNILNFLPQDKRIFIPMKPEQVLEQVRIKERKRNSVSIFCFWNSRLFFFRLN